MNIKVRIISAILAGALTYCTVGYTAFAKNTEIISICEEIRSKTESAVEAQEEDAVKEDDYKHFDPSLYDNLPAHEAPVRHEEGVADSSFAGYNPGESKYIDNATYAFFDEVASLYTDTHLYDFSKDQLMDSFFKKLIAENPLMFKMFLNTLLSTMDKYSSYHEAEAGFMSNAQGAYGIVMYSPDNAECKERGIEKGVYIKSVVKGSGAEKAGLKAGDRIVCIGDFNIEGLPFSLVQSLVKVYPFVPVDKSNEPKITINTIKNVFDGKTTDVETIEAIVSYFSGLLEQAKQQENAPLPEQTPPAEEAKKPQSITLVVDSNGEMKSLTIEKSIVNPSNIYYSYDYEKKIAYIQIEFFSSKGMANEMFAILEDFRKKNVTQFIIDLRDNGGGYADEAIAMANLFIESKGEVLFYYNSKKAAKPEPVKSLGTGKDYGDIAILVNENTASAAEILAFILRNHAGAKLFGTQTYGKAVGQSMYALTNGDSITITDSEILTPGLRSYNEIGLEPDLEIDLLEMHYEFPQHLRKLSVTYEEYAVLEQGVYSEKALAFEEFFSLFGCLDRDYVDGIIDENTVKAINAYLIANRRVPNGILEKEDIQRINDTVDKYKAYFYFEDTQLAVAKIYFSSFSQAKRLKKELETKSAKDQQLKLAMYEQFLKEAEQQENSSQA